MKITVNISNAFKFGTTNNKYFKDLPYLNDSQKYLLTDFVYKVSNGMALMGKNKESWLDDDRNEIPNTQDYKYNNFWHYHCGEYSKNKKIRSITYDLKLNLDGFTSSSIIHYRKVSCKEITVVGFSPEHIPFPKADDPENPLFED